MTSLCKVEECINGNIASMNYHELYFKSREEMQLINLSDWFYDKARATYYLPCEYCNNIYLDRNRLARIE